MTKKSRARRARDEETAGQAFISNDEMRTRSYAILRGMWPGLTDEDCLARVQGMSKSECDELGAQVMAQIVAERVAS